MNKEDPWDQVLWIFDHSDVYLVRDALQILNSDNSEFMKIGKLQLLISDWEAKNLSMIPVDGPDILSEKSGASVGVSKGISEKQQGESKAVLGLLLCDPQDRTVSETKRVCEKQ